MNDDSKKVALERVKTLFQLAHANMHDRPDLAQRYVDIARKVSMRTRLHLPPEYRAQICKHCKKFILPGTNSRVRIQTRREPHVVVTCLHCGGKTRIPLKGKKQDEQTIFRQEE
jgi:ribonuclease P protein subunit RPR2